MKSIGMFFTKFLLPLGAGWLLWQGAQRAPAFVSRGSVLRTPATEQLPSIQSIELERNAEERFVPQGTETIDPVMQETQPSTSPKDAATSVVTLGWGYRATEAQ